MIQYSTYFKGKSLKKIILSFLVFLTVSKSVLASDTTEKAGDAFLLLLPALAYGTTFYRGDSEGRDQFYKAFATNALVTYGLKYSVDKERPNKEDNHSFPSGHTSTTFQSATFLHQRYGFKTALPAYVGAIFTGYSRVKSDKHFVIDVLAGASIGALSSYFFTTSYKECVLTPFVSSDMFGLKISKRW
jgi:membrane-associated phospholipid phosphatase